MAVPPRSDSFEVTEYLGILRRRGWIALVLACLGGVLAGAYVATAAKSYTATSSVYVSVNAANANALQGSRTSGAAVNMDNEAQVVQSNTVAVPVIQALHSKLTPDKLLKQITVTVPANTTVLEISCSAKAPRSAAACAQAFANSYLRVRQNSAKSKISFELTHLKELEKPLLSRSITLRDEIQSLPPDSPRKASIDSDLKDVDSQLGALRADISSVGASVNYNPGYIISPAVLPSSASNPKPLLYLPSGLIAGLLIGLIAAFVLDRRDDRIHGVGDIERATSLPVLFRLPQKRLGQQTSLISPRSRPGRAFTELAEAIEAGLGDGNHVIVVAGASYGQHGSAVAVNLAATLARTRSEVLLICADVTGSATPRLLGVGPGRGLAEVVSGSATAAEVMRHPAEVGRLSLITPGVDTAPLLTQLDQNTSRRLVTDLRREFRFVIIEALPTGESSDIFSLAQFADAALIVAEIAHTRKPEIADCLARLDRMGTPVLGVAALPPSDLRRSKAAPAPADRQHADNLSQAPVVRGIAEPRGLRSQPSQPSPDADKPRGSRRDAGRPGRAGATRSPRDAAVSRPPRDAEVARPPRDTEVARPPRDADSPARSGETLPMPRITAATPYNGSTQRPAGKTADSAERAW